MKRILLVLLILILTVPAFADYDKPGKEIKVKPARATWNTGFFSGSTCSCCSEGTWLQR